MYRFIKANWFPIAILLLLLLAFLQRGAFLQSDGPGLLPGKAGTDLFTASNESGSHSVMGLLDHSSGQQYAFQKPTEAEAEAFLRRFSKVAMDERAKFNLPASVLLAHCYVNSFAGKRDLATQASNYAALTCGENWAGEHVTLNNKCFRKYNTPWESFRGLSLYLVQQTWVAEARKSAGTDWKKWIDAFETNKMSDVNKYPQEMAEVIRAFRLYELDE